MSHDPLGPIGPVERPASNAQNAAPAGADSGLEFRRLLETLERISAERDLPPADDVQAFARAVQRADDEFSTVMDLRRRLEDAFRGRLP